MSDFIFLFDLDSTISKLEILPTISKKIGKQKEMRELTEATMRGEIPFKSSFLNRVKLLSDIDVSDVNHMVSEIPLNASVISATIIDTPANTIVIPTPKFTPEQIAHKIAG